MKISVYGENNFGFVYVQGEATPNSDINAALKKAGGKPKDSNPVSALTKISFLYPLHKKDSIVDIISAMEFCFIY